MVFVHFHHTSQKMRFLFKFYGNMRLSVTNRKPIAGQAVKFYGLPHNKTGASGLAGSACFAESADRKEIKRAVRDSGVVFFAETVYAVYENPPLVSSTHLGAKRFERGSESLSCPSKPEDAFRRRKAVPDNASANFESRCDFGVRLRVYPVILCCEGGFFI